MTLQQRPYQVVGSEFLRSAGRGILGDEAGLGKGNQALMAAEGRTLIVSPASLESVWMGDQYEPGEVAMWRPDLKVEWTSYSSLCARTANASGRMTKVNPFPRDDLRGHWDTVIFDEAHYLKGRKTNWSIAAEQLNTERVYMLTGTPLVNWAHEIWMPLRQIHPAETKAKGWLGSYWRWLETWFLVTPSRWDPNARDVGTLLPDKTWDQFASEGCRIGGKWLRRERDDVLTDLPPMAEQVIHLPMTPDQAKAYKRLKKDLYARIEETGHEIMSWSAGGVWTKLLKLTSGVEMEDPDYTKLSNKLTAVKELVAEMTHPFLVFTTFRSSAERTASVLRDLGLRVGVVSGEYATPVRKSTVGRFKAGEYDCLVGTIGTMSEGLTLTRADTSIFLERDPRPGKNEQALRRIHRIGQTRPCRAIHLVTSASVDAEMLKLVRTKTDQQMAAMTGFDALQTLID